MKALAMKESAVLRRYGENKIVALKQGWILAKLKKEMTERVVVFSYLKRDMTIRYAIGTLKSNYIPETKGCNRKKNPYVQVYYDVQKNEWRSFTKANLYGILI